MEIVVNDTNIIIDLYNAGLLPYCRKLGLSFRTLDVIMEEIKPFDQRTAIQEIIDDGTLKVCSLSEEQVRNVSRKILEYQNACNLSFQDISVMVYAKDNNCRLLTGDRKLKEKAILENVKVSGILYLTDMMVKESIVGTHEMVAALRRLLESNNRLPKRLIKDRIETLMDF